MTHQIHVCQQRWTFAVGQGLLHYEEITLLHSRCRPISIVYDAGSFSKRKNNEDAAYQSIEEVNRYLKNDCDKTIDYLVLSHFHADHYNLMSKLLEQNKVGHFIAPLLTTKDNSTEITALAYNWLTEDTKSNGDGDEEKLITALVENGTDGFCEELFRGHERPDQFIYVTNEPRKSDNTEPIIHVFPIESDDNDRSQNEHGERDSNGNKYAVTISHNQPIMIADRNKSQQFWKMMFYYSTPDINPPKYWEAAKKELNNQLGIVLNKCSRDSDEIKPDEVKKEFEQIFSKRTYLPYEDNEGGNDTTEEKKVKFKDVFGYANVNMTSLTMYSGFNLGDKHAECWWRRGARFRSASVHEVANLLVHTAKENSNQRRQTLNEAPESESDRTERLRSLYHTNLQFDKLQSPTSQNSNLFWYYWNCKSNSPRQSYLPLSCERDFYWSWIGFGDMNFEDAAIADNLIRHFTKQNNLLKRVGCCSAPHHGSHNGFATDKIPSELNGAVCLISCDPNRKDYGHPRIEAVRSILDGGMLPILVSDQKETTFHEVLEWLLL